MCVRFSVGFLSGQECPRYGLVPMSVRAAAMLRLRRLETFQRQFMTVKNFMVWSSVLVLGTGALQAQTESVEQLKQQLKQANENFEKALQEQRRVIDDLTRRLQALEKQTNQPAAAAPTPAPEATPAKNNKQTTAQRRIVVSWPSTRKARRWETLFNRRWAFTARQRERLALACRRRR